MGEMPARYEVPPGARLRVLSVSGRVEIIAGDIQAIDSCFARYRRSVAVKIQGWTETELGGKVNIEVQKLNADAVSAMQKQGLEVIPADVATWRPSVERAQAVVRGGSVSVAFYDETRAARDACAGAKK